MPRKNSGRPAPRPSAARPAPQSASQPVHHAPPPQPAVHHAPPPAPMQPSGGGSMLGGIAGTIAEGMAFGTGSAIAHRAVDAVLGPRVVQHEHKTIEAPAAAPMATSGGSGMGGMETCGQQSKAFQDCITTSGSDISKCQFYLDLLNECRKSPSLTM